MKKTSSPLPNEDPSLHVSSGINSSSNLYFSLGHESTYLNLSETVEKMDIDPQTERLAPDQAKGEVERVLTLDSQSENEGMDDQLHCKGEKIRKPSFDFWDQVFPESWNDQLGMDAGTYSFIKMYERHDLAKHNAKPEVKAQQQKKRLADIINRRGERLRQSLSQHVPEENVLNDPSIPLYVLPLSARFETSTVSDKSQEESESIGVSTQNTGEGQTDHISEPDQKDEDERNSTQVLLLEYYPTSVEHATQATSSTKINDTVISDSESGDTQNTSNTEVKNFSKSFEDIQRSQTVIQSRLQTLEDNQVTIVGKSSSSDESSLFYIYISWHC